MMLRAALLLALFVGLSSAINVYVKPNQEQCFFEEARRGDKIAMTFAVASGGFLDIDVKVQGPDMRTIYEAEREKDGSIQFIALQDGVYRFCFGNTMSTVTGKTVSFNVYAGRQIATQEAAKKEHLNPLEQNIMLFSEGVYRVKDSIDYMKFRERVHRKTNESTNSRVLWWSVLEYVVLIGVGAFQMLYVKQFLERTRTR